MNIEQMTVEQLKALAYDSLVLIEQSQNNLKLINQELAKRAEVKEVPEAKKK
jgi:hypothetical protein